MSLIFIGFPEDHGEFERWETAGRPPLTGNHIAAADAQGREFPYFEPVKVEAEVEMSLLRFCSARGIPLVNFEANDDVVEQYFSERPEQMPDSLAAAVKFMKKHGAAPTPPARATNYGETPPAAPIASQRTSGMSKPAQAAYDKIYAKNIAKGASEEKADRYARGAATRAEKAAGA